MVEGGGPKSTDGLTEDDWNEDIDCEGGRGTISGFIDSIEGRAGVEKFLWRSTNVLERVDTGLAG